MVVALVGSLFATLHRVRRALLLCCTRRRR